MAKASKQYVYLTMTLGPQAGTRFLLDAQSENRIGRGIDCAVVLNDPLCSRVHAVVSRQDSRWHVEDRDSRNGTFVNGQRIDDAVLDAGHTLRVGSAEFSFELSDEPLTVYSPADHTMRQTVVSDRPMSGTDTGLLALAAIRDTQQAQQLLLLYQLSIKLLGCDNPDDVIRTALELLKDQTRAAAVGFLWVDDEGKLKPKLLLPEGTTETVQLSDSLTELVSQQGHAVWVNKQRSASVNHLVDYTDALCVPLISARQVLGAIHSYVKEGGFRQQDFDFAISLANIVAVALVRARQQSSLVTDYRRLVAKSAVQDEMIGECRGITELRVRIERVARASGCVLVRGESGCGKELVARAVHRTSARADRPMLTVNCAAIPAELMESQLFGHKAGAFTSADRDHTGFFQQADSGTLFLDEVGELTLEGQAKLLRILEGHPFLPVGSSQQVKVDVRVIAATNRDLQVYVRERKFREDLYYRLSVFELCIPPLRDRGSDLAMLLDHFLDHFRQQHGRPQLGMSEAARAKLLGYHWPGNVRQLRNVIDSAVVLASDPRIEIDDLGLRDAGNNELESLRIDFWERKLISEALKRVDGAVPEAAKLLGVSRATLYRKIEEYGVQR
ncbi:MAG: sigma 54-interacting transcriptional regulator [Planctomycetota bacterium]|nr:sigma 54-interacting transcriptional regulator [Planctomycetota bacterium]